MKLFALLTGCVLATILFVYMLTRIDSGGVAMLIGLVFGMLAAVPSVLLVLASSRKQEEEEEEEEDLLTRWRRERYGERALPPYPYQPPVIVLAAPVEQPQVVNNYTDARSVTIHQPVSSVPSIYDRQRQVAAERSGRVFRVVGQREEWDE